MRTSLKRRINVRNAVRHADKHSAVHASDRAVMRSNAGQEINRGMSWRNLVHRVNVNRRLVRSDRIAIRDWEDEGGQ